MPKQLFESGRVSYAQPQCPIHYGTRADFLKQYF